MNQSVISKVSFSFGLISTTLALFSKLYSLIEGTVLHEGVTILSIISIVSIIVNAISQKGRSKSLFGTVLASAGAIYLISNLLLTALMFFILVYKLSMITEVRIIALLIFSIYIVSFAFIMLSDRK